MDDNTHDVLMAVITLISAVVTPLIVVYVSRKQSAKIEANKAGIDHVVDRVDGYHKEVNGNMAKLLETTRQLAVAQEKARAEQEQGKK